MTTTETPTDTSTPQLPDAPEPQATAVPASSEPGTNGGAATAAAGEVHPSGSPAKGGEDVSEGASEDESQRESGTESASDDESQREGEAEGDAAASGDAQPGQAGATGERKKRRRRRKKKPHEGDDASTERGAEARAPGEDSPAEGGLTEAVDPNAAPKLRDKKREKKQGPPRERPPVNAGDIVFGKIIEITDEAILIDIPGKSKAIFDRREMLLADDDDSPPPRHAPAEGSPSAAGTEEAPAHTEGAAAALETSSTEEASPPETLAEPATEAAAPPASAVPDPAPAIAPEGEAPPPREPKVPRVTLEVGADFIAVVHSDGARGGLVVLTHHPHRAERAKPLVEKAFQDKTTIEGLVTGVIKGGVEVDVDGLRAFVPGSHIDMRLGADLSYLLAKRLTFIVTQYAKRGRDLVLSRKAMIEDEAKKSRVDALARLKIGEELEGTVRSVVSFGAFIDVGGIEGLVPLQEMSHNRGDGPNDVFKAGETTRVKVLKIDERGKIWLSHRATIPDPWQQVALKYAPGTKHSGKVARLQPFGAFIELESGIDGLIHLADLSINRIESPGEVVKVGDPIDVVVSHVDASNHKIALHPAPTGEAANETPQRVQPNKPVKAKVVTIESGGLVVRILGATGRNSRGYITSAGTGTPRGTELRKAFKIGQEVDAKVIEMDPRRGEVKLSIKALSEEQERSAYQHYRQQLKAEARFTFADLLAKKGPPPQR
jgi:small subunit ribosomal protein S1